jgi:hypothetical protein
VEAIGFSGRALDIDRLTQILLPEMTRMTRFGHSTPGAVSRSPSGDSDEIVLTHPL